MAPPRIRTTLGAASTFLLSLLLSFLGPRLQSIDPPDDPDQDVGAALDEILAACDDGAACAVGVVRGGELVHFRSVGSTDSPGTAPGVDTSFYIASMSKQFTAFAVLLLAQEGRLSLEDRLTLHMPELPDLCKAITIENLLHHTSGLRDYTMLVQYMGVSPSELGTEGLLDLVARQETLVSPPGTDFVYGNTGYWLLALIVERATELDFASFMAARVFRPLGMSNTRVEPVSTRIGAGGMHSTVRDLSRWDRNFNDGRLAGAGVLNQLTTSGALANGHLTGEAPGLVLGRYRGRRTQHHAGHSRSTNSQMLRFPDEALTVIALASAPARVIDADRLCRAIADACFGLQQTTEAAPESRALGIAKKPAPLSALRELVGSYVLGPDVFKVDEVEERLELSWNGRAPYRLDHLGHARYRVSGRPWIVEFALEVERRRLYLETDGHPGREVFDEPGQPDEVERTALAGTFTSRELATDYHIAWSGTSMRISLGDNRVLFENLVRLGANRYTDGSDTFFDFVVGAEGRATRLWLSDPRIGRIPFERLP